MIDPMREAANIQEFKVRRIRQLAATGLFMVVFIPFILVADGGGALFGLSTTVTVCIAMVVLVGVVVFSLINWRCPSCNGYLGKSWGPRFCPKCGAKLRD